MTPGPRPVDPDLRNGVGGRSGTTLAPALLILTVLALLAQSCSGWGEATADMPTLPELVQVAGAGCRIDGHGVGFVVEPGLVMTVAHAVTGSGTVSVTTPDDRLTGTVVLFDPLRDLALVSVPDLRLTPVTLLGTTEPEVVGVALPSPPPGAAPPDSDPAGSTYLAPAGLVRVIEANTTGIYRRREARRETLDVDFDASPGDSGAPVLDSQGRVVAMIQSVVDGGGRSLALRSTEMTLSLSEPRAPTGDTECMR